MLYDHEREKPFSAAAFENPPAIYRGTPFWAWNSKLDPAVLREQIGIFDEMGFGGFHMHVRQGLETPYLGREFFEAVRASVDEAKKRGLFAWLYDEDRWPSGCAGGEVTKTVRYRQKFLLMTKSPKENAVFSVADAEKDGAPLFLGAFDLFPAEDGGIAGYRATSERKAAENRRFFYCMTRAVGEPRFNGQTYVDTLRRDAIDRFLEINYDTFAREIGEEFGKTVPAIFTDEPQTARRGEAGGACDENNAVAAWTWDFPDTYRAAFGEEILDRLPEIFLTNREGLGSDLRYRYMRHLSERFAEAYTDNVGAWCEKHGILFTGHMMEEDSLEATCRYTGDVMRSYRKMGLPGIDNLFDARPLATPVQCRSAVRQYGREGMLSELYGVTGWDFDFRGHKGLGDYQACLGVTVRVPHLSWQTMKGEGKRDYPASIFYQSPWWREYKRIEDHFSRLNLALTRGEPICRVAVVHPIESFWELCAEDDLTKEARREADERFASLGRWLLTSGIDFDYLSESLLPELCPEGKFPLEVGAMRYDAVIVADCRTLRAHTQKVLNAFKAAGGLLVVSGEAPSETEGRPDPETAEILHGAALVPFTKTAILRALSPIRDLSITDPSGVPSDEYLSTRRKDGEGEWLFLCQAERPLFYHLPKTREIAITLDGAFCPTVYDTENGKTRKITFRTDGKKTRIEAKLCDLESLLLRLNPIQGCASYTESKENFTLSEIPIPFEVPASAEEENVLLLDRARASVDGGAYAAEDEMMRIDERIRKSLGFPLRRTKVIQPYAVAKEPEDHTVSLKFTVLSEIPVKGAHFAAENLEKLSISLNGVPLSLKKDGFYVDREIGKALLPDLPAGENEIEVSMPFGVRTDLENCYLIGDFGVEVFGRMARIVPKKEKLAFGDAGRQGYAFYGGNLSYDVPLTASETAEYMTEVSFYRGALVRVCLDGRDVGVIDCPPYRLPLGKVAEGEHTLTYKVFGNRYNTFSALHALTADKPRVYVGPDFWRTSGCEFAYEYQTRPFGILKTPLVWRIKKDER